MCVFCNRCLQEWSVEGTASHPLHAHINHMQLQDNPPVNYDTTPDWHQYGDHVDTISYPDTRVTARLFNERFGTLSLQQHIVSVCRLGLCAVVQAS